VKDHQKEGLHKREEGQSTVSQRNFVSTIRNDREGGAVSGASEKGGEERVVLCCPMRSDGSI